jgi:plasmid stability protein
MAQLLVRDITNEMVAELKRQAKMNGRSAEAEHRAILEAALSRKKAEAWAEIDRLRNELAESGRFFDDSTELLRQDRDTR